MLRQDYCGWWKCVEEVILWVGNPELGSKKRNSELIAKKTSWRKNVVDESLVLVVREEVGGGTGVVFGFLLSEKGW